LGGQGCAVFSKHALHYVRGFRVQVVDTVGAGDAFSAAFLHGMYSGWDITRSATFANALGALVASRAGATPVWTREECLALISKAAAEPHEKA
jgi:fructokinase